MSNKGASKILFIAPRDNKRTPSSKCPNKFLYYLFAVISREKSFFRSLHLCLLLLYQLMISVATIQVHTKHFIFSPSLFLCLNKCQFVWHSKFHLCVDCGDAFSQCSVFILSFKRLLLKYLFRRQASTLLLFRLQFIAMNRNRTKSLSFATEIRQEFTP